MCYIFYTYYGKLYHEKSNRRKYLLSTKIKVTFASLILLEKTPSGCIVRAFFGKKPFNGDNMKKGLIFGLQLMCLCLFVGHAPLLSKNSAHKKDTHFDVLRKTMARKINDIHRVDQILEAYKKLTKEVHQPQATWNVFEKWLTEKSYFIGSKHYNHDLVYEELPGLKKSDSFHRYFKRFVENILPKTPPKEAHHGKVKRITVLYSGLAGGGHKSPAVALARYCEQIGHKVLIIDLDEISNLYSPRVDGYTKAQIYEEIYQRQGNQKKATELYKRINKLYTPEKRKYLFDTKERIRKFRADHIFAVAHHQHNLSYLSYQLGIPMTYVHTDHTFNPNLIRLVKEQVKLADPLIQFGVLTYSKSFFENIHQAFSVQDKHLPPALSKQMVQLAFPVRPSFKSATKVQIKKLRKALHIPQNGIVCKLAMGQAGFTDELGKIVHKLIQEAKTLKKPLDVFVICAKNTKLKADLEKVVKRAALHHSKLHMHVCGFMEEKEMAAIDRASDVWITKPGGATCAELVCTQKQMLYLFVDHHEWEKTNAAYLRKLRLAAPLSLQTSITKQIMKRAAYHKKLNLKRLPKDLWREQVTNIIGK